MDKLDLTTLKHIKFMFDIHSDHSSRCNGYKSLLTLIEEVQLEEEKTLLLLSRNEKLNKINEK